MSFNNHSDNKNKAVSRLSMVSKPASIILASAGRAILENCGDRDASLCERTAAHFQVAGGPHGTYCTYLPSSAISCSAITYPNSDAGLSAHIPHPYHRLANLAHIAGAKPYREIVR